MSELSNAIEGVNASVIGNGETVSDALTLSQPVIETVSAPAPTSEPTVEAAVKPVKKSKSKRKVAKKVTAPKSQHKGKVGRPKLYTGKIETHIVSLIRKYGQTGARNILNAGNGKRDAELKGKRNVTLVPDALGISLPTLVKLSADHKIKLQPGRPKAA